MKSLSKLIAAGFIAGTVLSGSAFAQDAGVADPGHPRINQVDQRIDNQEQTVTKDVANGKISAAQGARDDNHLNNVQKRLDTDAAKNGGHITKREQRNLNKSLNKDKHRIHHQRVKDGTAK